MAFIELRNINKSFGTEDKKVCVLKNFNLSVEQGELVAIMGKSGCGKTTILNILAGIDNADSGDYLLDEKNIKLSKTTDGVTFRRNRIGIILQHFALINDYTVRENVELGLWEARISKAEMHKRTDEMLEILGIAELANKYPITLSGGEKQRVAIGRALVCKPALLLADEPTGSLDSETEKDIISLIKKINQETGTTTIIVTHDQEVADNCSRTIVIKKH